MNVMPATVAASTSAGPLLRRENGHEAHLTNLERRPARMAKASLPADEAVSTAWRTRVGAAFRRAVEIAGLSQKEAAAMLDRDAAQIARWIAGTERVQLDAVMAVDVLRGPFVLALATLADDIEVNTTITLRRLA